MLDLFSKSDKIIIANRVCYGNQIKTQFGELSEESLPMAYSISPCGSPFILEGEMKRCSKCKKTKPLSKFYRKKNNYQYICKECDKAMGKQKGIKHKRKYNGLYGVWGNMNNRCSNPSNLAFKWYGGRGIMVCQEWKDSFQAFYTWAKDKHKKGLTIDRKNNNGDYCSENCRFVTVKINNRNNSNTKLNIKKVKEIKELLKEGKLTQREIARKYNVAPTTISNINIKKYWIDV